MHPVQCLLHMNPDVFNHFDLNAQVIKKKKKRRISESVNSFLFLKYHRTYFWGGQKLSAGSVPVMPTLVHLPREHEIIAAAAFPQYTRIAKTFHKRTNQHLLHSAAHEHSTVRLFRASFFSQYVISYSSLYSNFVKGRNFTKLLYISL